MRAGGLVSQPTGYIAFVPAPLPPEPPLELTASQIQRVEAMLPTFAEFHRDTLKEWLDDFEKDADPEREIAIFEAMAEAYNTYCSGRALTPEERSDVYGLLLMRSGAPEDEVVERAQAQKTTRFSPEEIRAVLRCYTAAPKPVRVTVNR